MAAYWEKAAHSANDMFFKYKYLIVNLGFAHLGFWSGDFFLITSFPDLPTRTFSLSASLDTKHVSLQL